MAETPVPETAHGSGASRTAQAFGAARTFVERLGMLADWARAFDPSSSMFPAGSYGEVFGYEKTMRKEGWARVPADWEDRAFDFAEAFIAWYDLTHLLTSEILAQTRLIYPPGSKPITLGPANGSARLISTLTPNVAQMLTRFRRVELDATPYGTVLEAIAEGLGVYFRNAVYPLACHPLEPDTERIATEAKARATAREVSAGRPAQPVGWGADCDELMRHETRSVILARLGIRTYGDIQDLMIRQWKAQSRERVQTVVHLLRCDPIRFSDLRVQLDRESGAAITAERKLTMEAETLRDQIRIWVNSDSSIRPWLVGKVREAGDAVLANARHSEEMPQPVNPGDWREVRNLTPEHRLWLAVEMVVGLHDNGSHNPIWNAPVWIDGPPPDARFPEAVHDVLAEVGISNARKLSSDAARDYLQIVQAAWREAAEINGRNQRSKSTEGRDKGDNRPKTRRGLQRLAAVTVKDQPIVASLREGKSYRQVAKECKVSKSTVQRVAIANGLTGHAPEAVPFGGTLEEKLTIRGKSRKHGSK